MVEYNFNHLMSKRPTEMKDAMYAEIERLYDLPDRWLARELVSLSRHVVRTVPPRYLSRATASALLFDAIPEIAARLGETGFISGERSAGVRGLDNKQLRYFLSNSLRRDPDISRIVEAFPLRGFNPYAMLANAPSNGNPAVFAIDRFTTPAPQNLDRLAWEVYVVSGQRGHDCSFAWRPEFRSKPTFPPDYFVAPRSIFSVVVNIILEIDDTEW
jgi:hypothetical protein